MVYALSAGSAVAGEALPAPANEPFNLQVGLGYESSTSPFISLSDDGLFLIVDGNSKAAGSYLFAGFSGMGDRPLGSGLLAWSTHLESKHSPIAPDLDFSSAMADLSWALPVAANMSLSAGLSGQRMWVAGGHFRDVTGAHLDWSLGQPDGSYWVASSGITRNRHPLDYQDLDGQVWSASLHRRQAVSVPGFEGIDLEIGFDRERNARGNADLSQRRYYLRVGVDGKVGKFDWSCGVAAAWSKYDAAFMPEDPVRRERLLAFDLGVAWTIGAGQTLSVDAAYAVNQANSDMFDNSYRNLMLTWVQAW